METLWPFILAALSLTGSPGPNTLSLAAVGAAYGRIRGLPYMLGLNLGMALVILIVGSGVSGLLLAIPMMAPVVMVGAGLYFLYLAYCIATAPPLVSASEQDSQPKWFEGLFLSLVNPKAYAAMAAMFSSFVLIEDNGLADVTLKAALLMVIIITVNTCWLSLGAALTGLLKHEKLSRAINVAFSVMLIVSVVFAVAPYVNF